MLLVPHEARWADEFLELSAVYRRVLGTLLVRVEHVGSTSVPDLLAKPILDIDLVMESYAVFPQVAAALTELGYHHNGDQGIPQREAFKRTDPTVPLTTPRREWMTHHLYACPQDGLELQRHVRFREALRRNASFRREYEVLKLDYAARANQDKALYSEIKEIECRSFIEGVLKAPL